MILNKNKKIYFFSDLEKINTIFKKKFKKITFIDVKNISNFISNIKSKRFLIDSNTCSVDFETIINRNNSIIKYIDPIYYLKSIKSKNEIQNTIKAHIYDGAALTKFLFWLKKSYKKKG